MLSAWIETTGTTHVVVASWWRRDLALKNFIRRHAGRFELVYADPDHQVYRVLDRRSRIEPDLALRRS